jgi:hypothetical protein
MSNAERLAEHPNYDPDSVAEVRKILRDLPKHMATAIQLVSPRANEIAYGSNMGLPAAFAVGLLPYDRKRVTALISNPTGSGATVYIGDKRIVNAGGGFPLYPGKELTIASTADIYAMASAQVTLGIWIERDGGDD